MSDTTATDAPPELRQEFWLLVGVFNVALLAAGLGVLLVVIEGRPVAGLASLAVGVAAFAVGSRRYRARRNA